MDRVSPNHTVGRMPILNLTDRTVRSMKGETAQVDYWDASLPGFGVRVSPGGRRSWVLRYRVNGRQRRMTLGVYPHVGLSAARGAAKRALGRVAAGQDPASEKATERRAGTFRDLGFRYLEKHAKRKKRSWQADERMLNVELLPVLGTRRVGDISRGDVRQLLDDIAEDRPIMANRVLALTRKVFNFSIDEGVDGLEGNPCARLAPPGAERPRDRVLSRDEIRKLWSALDHEQNVLTAEALRLQLFTGQRIGEVLTVRWEDLDLAQHRWTIPASQTKNKRTHVVPLSPQAKAVITKLQTLKSSETWVFPSPTAQDKPLGNPHKAVARLRHASKVDFVSHDIRRTVATGLGELGVDRFIIARILNHVSETEKGITWVYDRYAYAAEKREALTRWGRHVRAITTGKKGGRS